MRLSEDPDDDSIAVGDLGGCGGSDPFRTGPSGPRSGISDSLAASSSRRALVTSEAVVLWPAVGSPCAPDALHVDLRQARSGAGSGIWRRNDSWRRTRAPITAQGNGPCPRVGLRGVRRARRPLWTRGTEADWGVRGCSLRDCAFYPRTMHPRTIHAEVQRALPGRSEQMSRAPAAWYALSTAACSAVVVAGRVPQTSKMSGQTDEQLNTPTAFAPCTAPQTSSNAARQPGSIVFAGDASFIR